MKKKKKKKRSCCWWWWRCWWKWREWWQLHLSKNKYSRNYHVVSQLTKKKFSFPEWRASVCVMCMLLCSRLHYWK